ncbi:MAG: hypothetical protein H6868_04270 [Rhodospirillales bacterium]|nr:hypothetical protein [Rhodospirillales bacterium]
MNQTSEFLLQFLEKLGGPLASAVTSVVAGDSDDVASPEAARKEAAEIATLLTKSVELSVNLAAKMDLKDNEENADALRLALAAMAAPLIAHQYSINGKIPSDAKLQSLAKTLEATLLFADNFTPGADITMRLANTEAGSAPADGDQISIQYICALTPVVNVVETFPFGQPEQKLVQDIARRLVKRATALRQTIGETIPLQEQDAKKIELRLLRALVDLYVQCHQAETNRLTGMSNEARAQSAPSQDGGLSMDPVWSAFETRAKMMEVLAGSLSGTPATTTNAAPAPQAPVEPPPAPAQATPPAPAQVSSPPPPAPESPPADDNASYNPMSFFKPGAKPAPDNQEAE